jgi:hypothetical protein
MYANLHIYAYTRTHTRTCMNTQGCPDMCCGRCCQSDTCPRHAGATEQGAAAGGHRRRMRGTGAGRAGQVSAPDVGVSSNVGPSADVRDGEDGVHTRTLHHIMAERMPLSYGGTEALSLNSWPPPVQEPSGRRGRRRGRGRGRGGGGFVAGSNDPVRPGVGAARPSVERERRERERERDREQRNLIPLAVAPSVLFGRWLERGGDAGS